MITDPDAATEAVIFILENMLSNLRKAKTLKEKKEILEKFDLSGYDIEEQKIDNTNVNEYEEYKKIKEIITKFFQWLEDNTKIKIFEIYSSQTFSTNVRNNRVLLISRLINELKSNLHQDIKNYLLLNIYRSIYEINLKFLITLCKEYDKINNKTEKFYNLHIFKSRFNNYENLEEILNYFEKDLRNPIAHEEWLIVGEDLNYEKDGEIKSIKMMELAKSIYDLFFFAAALQKYSFDSLKTHLKKQDITEDKVKKLESNLEIQIKNLKESLKKAK